MASKQSDAEREESAFRWASSLGVRESDRGTVLRVYAPRAESVSLVSSRNGWDPDADPMERMADGTWELLLPTERVPQGTLYKFAIRSGGRHFLKADPYARASEPRGGTASAVFDPDRYVWRDVGWLAFRADRYERSRAMGAPLHVYRIEPDALKNQTCGNLEHLPNEIVPYVKQMGYTHVELTRACGYQNSVGGYYAPTEAYGSPEQLMRLIDAFHEAGIGVLLEWSVTGFPKGEHGLSDFDGYALYEYADPVQAEDAAHRYRRFDLSSPTVRAFLTDAALFWVEKYHVDGFCFDDLSPTLYLDYGRKKGTWTPNEEGDSRSLFARDFFGAFNRTLAARHPDVITVARETTAWADVTRTETNGLGFAFKENSGWEEETRAFFSADRTERTVRRLVDPIGYAFSESHLLPLPRVSAEPSALRLLFAFWITYPGKKLTPFGAERRGDARLQYYAAALNQFYLSQPALWSCEEGDGFELLGDAEDGVLSYLRRDRSGKELLILIHLRPERRDCYRQKTPRVGLYEEIFNTDAAEFGGTGCTNARELIAESDPHVSKAGKRCGYLRVSLPPMGAVVLRSVENGKEPNQKTKK